MYIDIYGRLVGGLEEKEREREGGCSVGHEVGNVLYRASSLAG